MQVIRKSSIWCAALILVVMTVPVMAGPIGTVRIGPVDQSGSDVTLILSPDTLKKCEGLFRGQLSIYEVAPGIPVTASTIALNGACRLTVVVPWKSVSETMIRQMRGDLLQLRLSGDLIDGKSKRKVNWAVDATKATLILAEQMKETIKRFAKATDLQIGSVGLSESAVNTNITVQSPLGFDLIVQKITYTLEIHGAVVATGVKESLVILAAGRPTHLQVPVSIQHRALLSATSSVISKKGKVNGKLSGFVRLRLPGGNMDLPMEFPVQLNLI